MTLFSMVLKRLRREAGFHTAYYAKIERGQSLPRVESARLPAAALRLPF